MLGLQLAPPQRVLAHHGLTLGPVVAIAIGCRPLPDAQKVLPLPASPAQRWWFHLQLLPEKRQSPEHRQLPIDLPG